MTGFRRCPRCSGATGKLGTRKISALRVAAGRLERRDVEAPRLACSGCGHVFVDRAATGEALALDKIVEAALADGIAGAARTLCCDERSVRSAIKRWVRPREDDVPGYRPAMTALHPVRAGGEDRILICDADAMTLVDAAADLPALETWLTRRAGGVDLVVIPVDLPLREAAERLLPDAVVAVAPAGAAKAVLSAAERSLHDVAGRRNFREDATLLPKADADLSEDERDEISTFWSATAKGLRRHVQAVLAGLKAGRATFERRAGEARRFLDEALPRSSLSRLLSRWGDVFAAGAGQAWLDVLDAQLHSLARGVETTMKRASFDLVRIALVFREPGRSRQGGRDIEAVMASLPPGLPV